MVMITLEWLNYIKSVLTAEVANRFTPTGANSMLIIANIHALQGLFGLRQLCQSLFGSY